MPDITPKNRSSYRCNCGHQVGARSIPVLVERYETVCASCKQKIRIAFGMDVSITLSQDCAKFWDPQEVLNATWYHFSVRDLSARAWYSAVSTAETDTHLGTRKSSAMLQRWRVQDLMKADTSAVVNPVWKIKLRPGVRVFPKVAIDRDSWYPGIPNNYDVLRYINAWESAGQISLLARPSAFMLDI